MTPGAARLLKVVPVAPARIALRAAAYSASLPTNYSRYLSELLKAGAVTRSEDGMLSRLRTAWRQGGGRLESLNKIHPGEAV